MWWLDLKWPSCNYDCKAKRFPETSTITSLTYINNTNCLLWTCNYVRKINSYPNSHRKHGTFSNILMTPLEFLLRFTGLVFPTAQLLIQTLYFLLSTAPYFQWHLMFQTEPAHPLCSSSPEDWTLALQPKFLRPCPDNWHSILVYSLFLLSVSSSSFLYWTLSPMWTKKRFCDKHAKSSDQK